MLPSIPSPKETLYSSQPWVSPRTLLEAGQFCSQWSCGDVTLRHMRGIYCCCVVSVAITPTAPQTNTCSSCSGSCTAQNPSALGLKPSLFSFLSAEEPPSSSCSAEQSLQPQGSGQLCRPAQQQHCRLFPPCCPAGSSLHPADDAPAALWCLCQASQGLETASEGTAKDPAPHLSFTSATAAGREAAVAWCSPKAQVGVCSEHLQCFYYPH